MAAVRGLGAVRVGDAIGVPPAGEAEVARFPRPALEAVVVRPTPGGGGLAPGGAQPAGRAGPADRRPPGRPPPRDRGVAVRRGPEGGHRGDPRARLRHRRGLPRDDDRVHRAARARRRRPRRSSARRRTRTSRAAARRRARTRSSPRWRCGSSRRRPARASPSGRRGSSPRLVPLYLFHTAETFLAQMEAYVNEALAEGLAGWQVTDCVVTMTDCGYTSPATLACRLPPADAARAHDGARAGRDVGLRAARGAALELPASTAPGVLALLGPARRAGHRAVLGERRVTGRSGAAGRPGPRRSSTSSRACRWGRGSSRRARAATSRSGENPPRRERSSPSPLDRDAWLASLGEARVAIVRARTAHETCGRSAATSWTVVEACSRRPRASIGSRSF